MENVVVIKGYNEGKEGIPLKYSLRKDPYWKSLRRSLIALIVLYSY
jgi:hypothetical protein